MEQNVQLRIVERTAPEQQVVATEPSIQTAVPRVVVTPNRFPVRQVRTIGMQFIR